MGLARLRRRGLLPLTAVLIAALLAVPASAAADPPTVRAGCVTRVSGIATYNFAVCGVPDLDQVRAALNGHVGLPNTGFMYCAVTATMNWFAFLGEQGYVTNPPDKDWTLDGNFDEMSNDLNLLGQLMGTDPQKGTGGSGQIGGITSWLNANAVGLVGKNFLVVKSYETGSYYSPDPATMAQDAVGGGLVMPVIGFYANKTKNGVTHQARVGGHVVSLVSATGPISGNSAQLGVRDPNTDGQANSVQTPYATESWALAAAGPQTYYRLDSSGNPTTTYSATLNGVNGSSTTLYDGYVTIEPKYTASAIAKKLYVARAVDFYAPPSPDPPDLTVFNAPDVITDLAAPHEGMKTPFLVKGKNTVFQADAASGKVSQFARGPSGVSHLAWGGADQTLFAGGVKQLASFTRDGKKLDSANLAAPIDDLAFDAKANKLVGVSNKTDRLYLFSTKLKSEGSLRLPAAIARGSGALNVAIGSAGEVFVHQNNTPSIGQLPAVQVGAKGGARAKTAKVRRRTLAVKHGRGLAVDDEGHIFTAQNGKMVELLPNGKKVPDSRFAGRPAGPIVDVNRSFTNHDPVNGPSELDFLPDDQRVPPPEQSGPAPGPGPTPTPPPPGTPAPDLVIASAAAESITVKNQGTADAGPFNVRIVEPASGAQEIQSFRGLAAGASVTRTIGCVAHDRDATADSSRQVTESDENNNTATVPSCKP